MEFVLENAQLRVTVSTLGAELHSIIRKCDGVEHLWQGDPAVWAGQAPVLFPFTGNLKDGHFFAKGGTYYGGHHGFARNLEHTPVFKDEQKLVLELTDSAETMTRWPWRFRLVSTYVLEGDSIRHTLTVENEDEEPISFGIGFHPAFAVPFDSAHTVDDYELRFDRVESPLCLTCDQKGLLDGTTYMLGTNITTVKLDEQLFANDSHCMVGLHSETLGIYEKDSGRAVVCNAGDFPYVLLWSKPGIPKFVCMEPWNSTPGPNDWDNHWVTKPAAAVLEPGGSYSTTMVTRFTR